MIRWEYIFTICVVASATIGLATGNLSAHDYLYALGLCFSFLGGIGVEKLRRAISHE